MSISPDEDHHWMELALREARAAGDRGEIPVGAVLVDEGAVLAAAGNASIATRDPSAHAEILAIRMACTKRGNYRLPGTTLYVTLEPCTMCMGAMIHARIGRLVYGADDCKTGAAASLYTIGSDPRLNHQIVITRGICAGECSQLLREFFRLRRMAK